MTTHAPPHAWPHATLSGHGVTLEPLSPAHAAGLAETADERTLAHVLGRPAELTPEGVSAWIDRQRALASWRCYAVVVGGRAVGTTSFIDVNPQHRFCEIGATWIARGHHGSRVNPAIKLLMLEHAFDVQRCVRVALKTDSRNVQSQRAIEKLGAKKEGVLRKLYLRLDGTPRDTVMYSITDEEWAGVRAGLELRLE